MVSFALKYQSSYLDLEEDSYLTVDWFSTLFNESEFFRGSYSYAVKLKLSERNKGLLKMPHLIENRVSRQRIPVSIILFGLTWKNALLEIKVDGKSLSGNLLIDNSIIADILRDTTLPDLFSSGTGAEKIYEKLDIGQTDGEKLAYINNTLLGKLPVVFPIFKNYSWDGGFSLASDRIINRFSIVVNDYVILPTSALYCPMFFLTYLITKVCDRLGFTAKGSFFQNKEVATWILVNNSYYTGREILTSGFGIEISRHLPKITIGNFFKILRNDLKLPIYFDSLKREVTIDLPKAYLENNQFVDIGNHVIRDSIDIAGGELKKFIINRAMDSGDSTQQYFDSIDSLSIGASDIVNKVELNISAPKMSGYWKNRFNNYSYRMPIVDQLANIYDEKVSDSAAFNKKGEFTKNEFSISILSWRGLMSCNPENLTHKIPYATADTADPLNNSNENWIATDPLAKNGWLRKICEPFYQMLSLSENVEFNAFLPINLFQNINPLSKIVFRTENGSIGNLAMDKIAFEPANRNSMIYCNIKGASIARAQYLFGVDLDFKVEKITTLPNCIYVFARFEPVRVENTGTGQLHYGKVYIEFFKDRYMVLPVQVNGLEMKIEMRRYFKDSDGAPTLYFERTFITGANAYDFLSDEEFPYWSYHSGKTSYAEISFVDIPDNSYIPILPVFS